MDGVRSCIKNAFEGYHVDIVMNANGPKTSNNPMSKHKVDGKWDEEATGKYWYGLGESIQGMESKP